MTCVGTNKKRGADGDRRPILPRDIDIDFEDVLEVTTSSKLALKFPKIKAVKGYSASGTTANGEVDKTTKKMRDRVRLVAHKGTEELSASMQLELSKMVARFLKGIYLGIEGRKTDLESGKAELEKKVARLKSDLALEGERLVTVKAAQEVLISELTEEAQNNVDDIALECDRLGPISSRWGTHKLTLKPYGWYLCRRGRGGRGFPC
ncbi:hypothetical protein GIB67_007153 [Kingdonia uniflora]|uniref:Uncharacterized protein n=1 Tax=Kingdonia uniflora TaxID=39325 RepID=A0A7J7MLF4_9MAGN|nr:hypothetical protein GIB67_007153 [Kingdonia uniflora]